MTGFARSTSTIRITNRGITAQIMSVSVGQPDVFTSRIRLIVGPIRAAINTTPMNTPIILLAALPATPPRSAVCACIRIARSSVPPRRASAICVGEPDRIAARPCSAMLFAAANHTPSVASV